MRLDFLTWEDLESIPLPAPPRLKPSTGDCDNHDEPEHKKNPRCVGDLHDLVLAIAVGAFIVLKLENILSLLLKYMILSNLKGCLPKSEEYFNSSAMLEEVGCLVPQSIPVVG